ncbi:hypothetical protein BaRGS_00015688 [Batillaria attramentaria]|uniref:Uncharacterized protein n=1 Tax=Batillaria attramentaria TaxID=370345 RepID=A0ABD0L0Z1_9CAEN
MKKYHLSDEQREADVKCLVHRQNLQVSSLLPTFHQPSRSSRFQVKNNSVGEVTKPTGKSQDMNKHAQTISVLEADVKSLVHGIDVISPSLCMTTCLRLTSNV